MLLLAHIACERAYANAACVRHVRRVGNACSSSLELADYVAGFSELCEPSISKSESDPFGASFLTLTGDYLLLNFSGYCGS